MLMEICGTASECFSLFLREMKLLYMAKCKAVENPELIHAAFVFSAEDPCGRE